MKIKLMFFHKETRNVSFLRRMLIFVSIVSYSCSWASEHKSFFNKIWPSTTKAKTIAALPPIDKQKLNKKTSVESSIVASESQRIAGDTFIVLIVLVLLIGISIGWFLKRNNSLLSVEPFFMPSERQRCTKQIFKDIRMAKETICIASYWFSHLNIILALRKARKRNIAVTVIFDKSTPNIDTLKLQLKSSRITFVESDLDAAPMHHKFIIIDNAITWLGSANLTVTAFHKNYENILRINSTEIAKCYRMAFDNLASIFRGSAGLVQNKHTSVKTKMSTEDFLHDSKPISDYQKKFLDDCGIHSQHYTYDTAYALINKVNNSAWRSFIKGSKTK